MKGQIIGGEFGKILLRQKSEEKLELGELLITQDNILLQVYSLNYGSQISMQNLELISGMKVEEGTDAKFFDNKLRNYKIALLKTMITINGNRARVTKTLPKFFSLVREIEKHDLSFISTPHDPLFVGNLRSGSKELDVPISLPGKKVLSHHVLVTATTGRGKSNLTANILWHTLDKDFCGFLVLDPHDEYFGRNGKGLKNHSRKERVVYYSIGDVPPGGRTLKINLKLLRPSHFNGVMNLSDPQMQALFAYFKKYGDKWITSIILDKPLDVDFHEGTIAVLKRRLLSILDLEYDGERLFCHGIYDLKAGETTIFDIVGELESAKTVIIDTSSFSGPQEILVGSLVANEIFRKYKSYKKKGILKDKPVVSVVLEEAPRVLGKEVLEKGSNIFSTIAREGRKFSVGLFAITQLPSLIPRQILANMNTKIILGVEMAAERQAIIESAAQDLSTDSSAIASLDVGEAIITSNFTKFAMPVKIPYFVGEEKKESVKSAFSGVQINPSGINR